MMNFVGANLSYGELWGCTATQRISCRFAQQRLRFV